MGAILSAKFIFIPRGYLFSTRDKNYPGIKINLARGIHLSTGKIYPKNSTQYKARLL